MSISTLVFTDLDGTLLDHADYSYEAARPALEFLQREGIPLVLCTSKTAAEISSMRQDPALHDCTAIVENGAGILRAGAQVAEPAATHQQLMQLVDRLPEDIRAGFSGFSSWSPQTLMEHTGLDPDKARYARQRDYSEPGLWQGSDSSRRQFIDALESLGIRAQQGGRFLTLGFANNKADRMMEIVDEQRLQSGSDVISVALGDAANDIEMLERADFGIVIPNPAHAGLATLKGESTGRILRAQTPGPTGWRDSLLTLLKRRNIAAKEN